MSHRPSNGVNGCTVHFDFFYIHAGFNHNRRPVPHVAWQIGPVRPSTVIAADIIDSPLKPATFTLEPYRHLGQVCMSAKANLRVADHTTLSPSIRVARARAARSQVAAASGLGFALFVQQVVTQNQR
jgi:hypothetical protein